jgi:formate-dependent nitrite reductase membrane component NrfD
MGAAMLEYTTTRHNPLVDPHLAVWSWEIPLYLFVGGIVAGLMILGGIAMLRMARGEDTKGYFSLHAPLAAFMLLNVGMGALFLDLAHKLYVWAVYLTFQPTSPMSWGSWVLIIVYPLLLASALIRLPEAWPWLARRFPVVGRLSDALLARPDRIRLLAWVNVVLGVALGIYTGILLSALGARPLWSSALLGPLFLLSGLSSAAAFVHMVARSAEEREELARADNLFLLLELATILLFFVGLLSSTEVHKAAAGLLLGGPFTAVFWVGVVGLGIVFPLVIQSLAVKHRVGHTPLAPLLVMAGGLALRFVFVYAGQVSHWAAGALDVFRTIG